jgi:hypothetical protein
MSWRKLKLNLAVNSPLWCFDVEKRKEHESFWQACVYHIAQTVDLCSNIRCALWSVLSYGFISIEKLDVHERSIC